MDQNNIFWKQKLIRWESLRYGKLSFVNVFAIPLRQRMKACQQTILDLLPSLSADKIKIVEYGCGSGVLASQLKSIKHSFDYIGYDLSEEGVERANSKSLGSNFSFQVRDLKAINLQYKSDISIFLGLSDWLSKEENKKLLLLAESKYFIWSYTLKDNQKVDGATYSVFRRLKDRKRLCSKSWSRKEVDIFLKDCGLKRYREDQKFSFGPGFISCLVRE